MVTAFLSLTKVPCIWSWRKEDLHGGCHRWVSAFTLPLFTHSSTVCGVRTVRPKLLGSDPSPHPTASCTTVFKTSTWPCPHCQPVRVTVPTLLATVGLNEITLPGPLVCRKCQVSLFIVVSSGHSFHYRCCRIKGALIPSRVWRLILLWFDSFLVLQFIASIEKNWFCQNRHTDIENKPTVIKVERGWGRDKLGI